MEKLATAESYLQQHYLDTGRLAGAHLRVVRRGETAIDSCLGLMDRENEKPNRPDAIYRIYSMTKPIVSVALMMLYERGLFRLDEPIFRYLPEFSKPRVREAGAYPQFLTRRASRGITFTDLLTHQSGLTYGFLNAENVDHAYRKLRIDTMAADCRLSLAEWTEQLAKLPLVFHPGERWNYSVATDVIGRLIEVLSDQPLDDFLAEHIFDPLGMVDTHFDIPAESLGRFASCYEWRSPKEPAVLVDSARQSVFHQHGGRLSGGGGLVSTVADYDRFCRAVLGGGVCDGVRILAPATLEYMHLNHIYGGGDIASSASDKMFTEVQNQGVGFGLGFSVALDPIEGRTLCSVGEVAWGGLASTAFWVDAREEMFVIFMTQLIPSATYTIRRDLKSIIYGALGD